jgi:hypothetical protein
MNGHFVDGFARSLDIDDVEIFSAKGYSHENGSNDDVQRCAQANGSALFLCGDRCLSLINPQSDQIASSDGSAGRAGE